MKLYHAVSKEIWEKRISKEGLKSFPTRATIPKNDDTVIRDVGQGIWFSDDPEYFTPAIDNPVILEVDTDDILHSSEELIWIEILQRY